jgi:hypothetical protein
VKFICCPKVDLEVGGKIHVRSGKCEFWEMAFQEAHADQQLARRTEDEPLKRHMVDKSAVCELQKCSAGEMHCLKLEFAQCNCWLQRPIQNLELGKLHLELSRCHD